MPHTLQYYIRSDKRNIFDVKQLEKILKDIKTPISSDNNILLKHVEKNAFMLSDAPLLLTETEKALIGEVFTAGNDGDVVAFKTWVDDATIPYQSEPLADFPVPPNLTWNPPFFYSQGSSQQTQVNSFAAQFSRLEQIIETQRQEIAALRHKLDLIERVTLDHTAQIGILINPAANPQNMFSHATDTNGLFSNSALFRDNSTLSETAILFTESLT